MINWTVQKYQNWIFCTVRFLFILEIRIRLRQEEKRKWGEK